VPECGHGRTVQFEKKETETGRAGVFTGRYRGGNRARCEHDREVEMVKLLWWVGLPLRLFFGALALVSYSLLCPSEYRNAWTDAKDVVRGKI
jgi:hypothetical protein